MFFVHGDTDAFAVASASATFCTCRISAGPMLLRRVWLVYTSGLFCRVSIVPLCPSFHHQDPMRALLVTTKSKLRSLKLSIRLNPTVDSISVFSPCSSPQQQQQQKSTHARLGARTHSYTSPSPSQHIPNLHPQPQQSFPHRQACVTTNNPGNRC